MTLEEGGTEDTTLWDAVRDGLLTTHLIPNHRTLLFVREVVFKVAPPTSQAWIESIALLLLFYSV